MPDHELLAILDSWNRAVAAATDAAEGRGDPGVARTLARNLLRQGSPPNLVTALLGHEDAIEGHAILCALTRIAGEPPPNCLPGEPVAKPWAAHMIEAASAAWCAWAHGSPEIAVEQVALLRAEEQEVVEGPGAVHRMALENWAEAIAAISEGKTEEARRLWLRAIEIGSSFGTESHLAVLWTYAATFQP